MFKEIVSIENLSNAFDKVISNMKVVKRERYINKKEITINYLHKAMSDFTWQMEYSKPFCIKEKNKVREIICCSFKDKVAQQAILNLCEPIFTKCLIADSYQAQKGKGIHKASVKLQRWIKNFSKNGYLYFLHLDIKKYYNSIDSKILLEVLSKKIKCNDTLKLIEILLAGDKKNRGKGVTLGNSISQWFGNMYLYDLDHFFSSFSNVKYIRYADDMIFISNEKEILHKISSVARLRIKQKKLKLSINHLGRITEKNPLDTLGYKHFINKKLVRKRIKHNLSKAFARNKQQSISSLLGHTLWANSKKMLYNIQNKGVAYGKTA